MHTIMILGEEYRVRGPLKGVAIHAKALLEMLGASEAIIRKETLARVDSSGSVVSFSSAAYVAIVRREETR